jgi:hypothetical protein
MLALDDGALARLCIAATRLPPAARAALLARLAVAAGDASPTPRKRRRRRSAHQRAQARARWHRHAALRRAKRALCPVIYDEAGMGKLIETGWLPRQPDDQYTIEAIGAAISDLVAYGNLPTKK